MVIRTGFACARRGVFGGLGGGRGLLGVGGHGIFSKRVYIAPQPENRLTDPHPDGEAELMTPSQRLVDMFAAAGVQQPEDSVGFLLWRVAHRHQREVDRALAPLGLTHLQFAMLVQTAWLSRVSNRVSQAELGRFSKVHPMQLSSVLKALEAKDLIARPRCPGHGRAKQIVLTDTPSALLATALPRVTALQGDFFGGDPAFGHDLHDRLRRWSRAGVTTTRSDFYSGDQRRHLALDQRARSSRIVAGNPLARPAGDDVVGNIGEAPCPIIADGSA